MISIKEFFTVLKNIGTKINIKLIFQRKNDKYLKYCQS